MQKYLARMADNRLISLTCLVATALILRGSTFGDPNLHADETFYFATGIAMHQGALPYVDVWDRKPPGLFLIYYLITALGQLPINYQLAATVSAVATAAAIGAIARRWSNAQGALLAGMFYLVTLGPFQGFGGQSPVFYNLFIALAALLVVAARPQLRAGRRSRQVAFAMALAGFAVTIKTTAIFEAAFLGLYAGATLLTSPMRRSQAIASVAFWTLLGAAPSLIFAASYAAIGHWHEYAHAVFAGGLNAQSDWPTAAIRLRIMFAMIAPYFAIAAFGLLEQQGTGRRFLFGWLAAALIGLASVPRFYPHYALPLLVPLAVAAAAFLSRPWLGPLALIAAAIASLQDYWPFDFTHTARSQAAMTRLADAIRQHDGGHGLLVFDGPVLLYAMTDHKFLSPLAFPPHLNHGIEKDASHLPTLGEMKRILAQQPGAVVNTVKIRNGPANQETRRMVLAYIAQHCHPITVERSQEELTSVDIAVFGDCT